MPELRDDLLKQIRDQKLTNQVYTCISYWPLRKMSVEQFQGCRWNNFTDEWNAQIVSKAATKLRKHIQKWKIKCLFKALSLTIVLQCHLFMNSLLELVLQLLQYNYQYAKITVLNLPVVATILAVRFLPSSRRLKLGVNAVVSGTND